jgi:hypothetical protein
MKTPIPSPELLKSAVDHVEQQHSIGQISLHAAQGILYSLGEVLGTLLGDPDLPEHAKSGYQGVLDVVHALESKLL